MKHFKFNVLIILIAGLFTTSCSSWNKTQKGAVVGTAAGGATGAVIGKVAGNTALGAIIGATVGGVTGALIGRKMDKQAEEIKKTVPDAKVLRVGEGIVVEFGSNVMFDFDKANLSSDAKTTLEKLVTVMNTYPDTNIEIQGHTDSKGSDSYNMNLSRQRAYIASDYLIDNNVSRQRVSAIGFGETLPKYLNDTDAGRTQNRRVEFLITANEKMKAEAEKEAAK
ncbi:MAG: OmpA family protein [Saprospiraceae bacterium]|nr:OmpA family protein [Saprospiraceae bacterium]